MQRLQNKIAVVTGASRGAGRGIARVLGEESATVYVTGRSTQGNNPTLPELTNTTIEHTAEQINARGGVGIAVRCDHTEDAQVEALFERVRSEQGRLDILVNNVWGGYEGIDETFVSGFWKQPLWRWDKMFQAGVRAHFTASHFAAPLMIEHCGGLIVNTTFWNNDEYISNLAYDVAKCAINRLAFGMAYELRDYNITAVALSPGWMRTEAVLHSVSPNMSTTDLDFYKFEGAETTESIEYIGRAIVALATDPQVIDKSGQTLRVGDLANEYGFTDIDGRVAPPFISTLKREDRDL